VRNIEDAERVRADLAARQRAREQVEHERLVEEEKRKLGGDAA
jgi:hypothetical protein